MKNAPPSRRAVLGGLAAVPVLSLAVPGLLRAAGAGRIVALGGAVTEIVYALGLGDRIVAVDVTSQYPAEAGNKPNVGYYRQLSAEGVLALAPDVVVAADGAGPTEALDVLKAASVKFVALDEVKDARDVATRIRAVAEALGEAERGAALAEALAADLAIVAEDVSRIPKRRRALALLGPSRGGTLMAAGRGSTGDAALSLAGADNAASAMSGWKPLVDEAAYGLEPDAILIARAGAPVSAEDVAQHPGLSASPAVREGRIVVADALGLLGFGPRAAHVLRSVAQKIYPEATFRGLPARTWADGASQTL